MKRGKSADTLFSEFWNTFGHLVDPKMPPYYLMRWAFREGFIYRRDRDRAAKKANSGGKDA